MRYLILLLVLVALLGGCAQKPFLPPAACDNQPSLILSTFPDPFALDSGLLSVNLAALELIDGYRGADARRVLDQVEAMVSRADMTYAELAAFITTKLQVANALAGGLLFVVGPSIDLLAKPVALMPCDVALIRAHLAKQKMLVTIYGE
jgi:hypothetical protein